MSLAPRFTIHHACGTLCVLALLIVFNTAVAENLADAERVLCAPVRVSICVNDGTCVSALPWEVNFPQFIEVDFKEKHLATTEASNLNRMTPFESISHQDGIIFLQGVENGRAFSFAINESTGFITAAVARDSLTVTGFGVCTPTD